MSTERIKGSVKWFSNKKGYGFITPAAPADTDTATGEELPEDIFVHQSVITSEGYRTLDDGWEVEFTIGFDQDGKPKAENVTGVGGGACQGPRKPRRRRRGQGEGQAGGQPDAAAQAQVSVPAAQPQAKVVQPVWHDDLKEEVKDVLDQKGIARVTGTLDIAIGDARVKLGTRGYASVAQKNKTIAEGSFSCDQEGQGLITLEWKRAIQFGPDDVWDTVDSNGLDNLIAEVNLLDQDVKAVGLEENMASLVGEELPDPKSSLEAAGFEMRRVVLATKKRGT
jgi:CspA family cold shock protein